jgi:protein-S-isoprenylcysteine O-methyltransferase Ste14
MFRRIAVFIYGVVSYAVFFGTFLYAIGFVGNLVVPKSMDSARMMSVGQALGANLFLLTLFALQHSIMARPAFKRVWKRVVGEAAERSTYVLASSLALILLFWGWAPIGGTIWSVESTVGRYALYGVFFSGWAIVLATTFLINHFDLFGLRQVWLYLIGKPYTPIAFRTPGPYRWVRHPLYVGWLLAFWGTPTMTVTHLVFALMTTGYILTAIQFEERDLVDAFGDEYRNYQKNVPMIVPGIRPAAEEPTQSGATVRS